MAKKQKILFYNWIQFDEPNNIGGGVNVYQKNLIEELIKSGKYEVFFLSSGTHYDIFRKKPYIKKTKNIFNEKCHSFHLINSPCTAPISTMYQNLDAFLTDEISYKVLKEFISVNGGFDIIHFNNIEGLSSKCLEIKKDFPKTKIIYSIHNYSPFTPEVNMFYLSETKTTLEVPKKANQKKSILFYKLDTKLRKIGLSNLSAKILVLAKTSLKKANDSNGTLLSKKAINKYNKTNVARLNKYVDDILAVSKRTGEIAIKHGVLAEKVKIEYIGTAFAKKAQYKLHHKHTGEHFTIAYMGYFDKAKGFDFLINALEGLNPKLAKKLDFVCYAKIKTKEDEQNIARVKELNNKLHSAKHYNGYTHAELPKILEKIDLGIVPVIWEDNLPQVAIEYAAHGVPVLTSNLGGAHELSDANEFIFKAFNKKDFEQKLQKIVNDTSLSDKYFEKMMRLNTLKDHAKQLEKYYA